jgi:hypothetical protein
LTENGDPEIVEDTVNYKWWCSGGAFSGTDEGMSVTWVAPPTGGSCTVRVTAWDTDSRAPRGDGSDDDQDKIAEMTMYVVKVDIEEGENTITGQTQNTIVGRHISLEGVVAAGGLQVTNHAWTVPGKAIANYTASSELGTVTPLTSLSSSTVSFYWVDGGDGRQVTYVATVGGHQFSATTTFNVKRPTASVTATTGQVKADDEELGFWALHFGKPGGKGEQGIYFERTIEEPAGFEGGATKWVQVVDGQIIRRRYLEAWQWCGGIGYLDTVYPYSANAVTSDRPYSNLSPAYNLYTRTDEFSMYLMYTPTGAAIDVPLRKVGWSWSGQASRIGGGPDFQLDSDGHSTDPGDSDCTDHPEWEGNHMSDWEWE